MFAVEAVAYQNVMPPLTENPATDAQTLHVDEYHYEFVIYELFTDKLGWSFWLGIVACLMTLASSMVICAFNRIIVEVGTLMINVNCFDNYYHF